jgi:hypothetical protein
METYRTTKCGQHGHRELTVQLREPSPIPNLHNLLVDYFEDGVATGKQFKPGQTVRLGWATLRLCERADGTIGVEEREPAPTPTWVEGVDRALHDVWLQKEIVASVGLLDQLSFPSHDEMMMISDCAIDAPALIMTRIAGDDLPEDFSGWMISCAEDHDHGERHALPLLALAANHPGLVQLLALPRHAVVLVVYAEKPNAPEGTARIEPHVFWNGEELAPKPGSYLAALQA